MRVSHGRLCRAALQEKTVPITTIAVKHRQTDATPPGATHTELKMGRTKSPPRLLETWSFSFPKASLPSESLAPWLGKHCS